MKIDREPIVNRFGRVAVDEAIRLFTFKQLEYAKAGATQTGIGQVLQELIEAESHKQGADSLVVQVLKEILTRTAKENQHNE